MTSLTRRYLSGEHEAVWEEIRALGPVPAALSSDVDGVAEATMLRVRPHADRLAAAYAEAGLVVKGIPIRSTPTDADRREVDRLGEEIGGLPAALRFCLTEVGGLWLAGDCPALGLYYHLPEPGPVAPVHPDPLVLPGAEYLDFEWTEYREDEEAGGGFRFSFAPDEHHKANISGSTQDIELPQAVADPPLEGVRQLRRATTLIEYLRWSIAWAGCPGWSLAPDRMPPALRPLRVTPDF